MALSVSFNFRWEPTVPRVMSDLADDILRRRREAEQERDFQTEKAGVVSSKIGARFWALKDSAKQCVDALRAGDRAFSELWFSDDNAANFTVTNLSYPYAKVEVQLGNHCIQFSTTTQISDTAPRQHKADRIDVSLDDQWKNLVLSHQGDVLPGDREALAVMLNPATERR